MRIAIVYTTQNPATAQVHDVAAGLDESLTAKGHQVTRVDISKDDQVKVSMNEYVIVVAQPLSFFSKRVAAELGTFLANSGSLIGKRGSVVLVKRGLLAGKSLTLLMKVAEHEGIYLKNSAIVGNRSEAKGFGTHLQL